MARIRTIKPEFWSDEKLSKVSYQARLIFIGFWNLCDDFGNFRSEINYLRSNLFPFEKNSKKTLRKFQNWLDELIIIGRIIPYTANSENFFNIPNFNKHQVINRPSKMRYPPPPILTEDSLNTHGALSHGTGNGRELEVEVEEESEEKPKVNPLFSLSKGKDKSNPKIYYPDAALTDEEKADRYRRREEAKEKARRDSEILLRSEAEAKHAE